jgi:hypothetical protein
MNPYGSIIFYVSCCLTVLFPIAITNFVYFIFHYEEDYAVICAILMFFSIITTIMGNQIFELVVYSFPDYTIHPFQRWTNVYRGLFFILTTGIFFTSEIISKLDSKTT